jgi:translation initiation factor 2B subunit (eIF-2B alpha/beta/delta family)
VDDLAAPFEHRIAALAGNRESGASELLVDAVAILRDALASGAPITPVARAVCRAQPAMACIWNAASVATAPTDAAERLDRFAQRAARAVDAITRFALDVFKADPGTPQGAPLRLVTLSYSGTVAAVFDALHRERPIRVSCNESRPALEGRRLASRLASGGIPVTCFGDAAIGQALAAADALLVGADAVGPEWFMNKSGTRMLAAAAAHQGIPVYVIAARDKFVTRALGARLEGREGASNEIWDGPPRGIAIRNPYFEPTPLDLITAVISDIGVLGAAVVPEACEGAADAGAVQRLD